jgi:hypothetical protein
MLPSHGAKMSHGQEDVAASGKALLDYLRHFYDKHVPCTVFTSTSYIYEAGDQV